MALAAAQQQVRSCSCFVDLETSKGMVLRKLWAQRSLYSLVGCIVSVCWRRGVHGVQSMQRKGQTVLSSCVTQHSLMTQRRGAGGRPHHSEGCSRLTPQDACTFRCVAHATRIGIARIPALGCCYAGGFGPCPCSVTGSNQCALLPKERAGPGHGVPLPFLRKPPPQQPPAPTVFFSERDPLTSTSATAEYSRRRITVR